MLKLCPLMLATLVGQVGSSDTILKGDQLRTISSKFDPNRSSSFRGEDF